MVVNSRSPFSGNNRPGIFYRSSRILGDADTPMQGRFRLPGLQSDSAGNQFADRIIDAGTATGADAERFLP
jgi:hypothetical protein